MTNNKARAPIMFAFQHISNVSNEKRGWEQGGEWGGMVVRKQGRPVISKNMELGKDLSNRKDLLGRDTREECQGTANRTKGCHEQFLEKIFQVLRKQREGKEGGSVVRKREAVVEELREEARDPSGKALVGHILCQTKWVQLENLEEDLLGFSQDHLDTSWKKDGGRARVKDKSQIGIFFHGPEN